MDNKGRDIQLCCRSIQIVRWLQILCFALGAGAFLASLFFMGRQTGEDLWKAGIAIMLFDIVLIMLWPRKTAGGTGNPEN